MLARANQVVHGLRSLGLPTDGPSRDSGAVLRAAVGGFPDLADKHQPTKEPPTGLPGRALAHRQKTQIEL